MGTKCCWKENKDNQEHRSVDANKFGETKEARKGDNKKNVNIKRKSYPSQNKKNNGKLKRIQDIEIQEKRSSTASFHSASSFIETTNTSISNNNDSFDAKYQG